MLENVKSLFDPIQKERTFSAKFENGLTLLFKSYLMCSFWHCFVVAQCIFIDVSKTNYWPSLWCFYHNSTALHVPVFHKSYLIYSSWNPTILPLLLDLWFGNVTGVFHSIRHIHNQHHDSINAEWTSIRESVDGALENNFVSYTDNYTQINMNDEF